MTFQQHDDDLSDERLRVRLRFAPHATEPWEFDAIAIQVRPIPRQLLTQEFVEKVYTHVAYMATVYCFFTIGPKLQMRDARPSDRLGSGFWFVFDSEEGVS